jgi:hypothetical protein
VSLRRATSSPPSVRVSPSCARATALSRQCSKARPCASSSTRGIAAVAAALANGASLVAPAHGGRRGHPVGFAARWRADLLGLRGDEGARQILAAHADELVLLPTDDTGVLRDVDRVADLAAQAARSSGTPRGLTGRG